MKNSLLLILLFAFTTFTFGQDIASDKSAHHPYGKSSIKTDIQKARALKTEGEVFFEETFDWGNPDDPNGWTLPEGWETADLNDLGHNWVWRAGTDSIKGMYTFEKGHIYSESPDDGYFVMPIDEYNFVDGVNLSNGLNVYFDLPRIDCTGRPSVVLSFNQNYRFCCGTPDIKVQVSADDGVHWADFDMRYATPINVFCANPHPEVNISGVAANQPNILVRFAWTNSSHYFWCIDDIQIKEGYANELQLESNWQYMNDNDEYDTEGFIRFLPFSQIGNNNFGAYTFEAGFLNAGMDMQTNCHLNVEVLKNGESVYTANSDSRAIVSVDRDTFLVEDPFMADDYGDYQIVMNAAQDQEDGVPDNNVYKTTFHVTDYLYGRSDFTQEEHLSTAGHGNNDGDFMGVFYEIDQATEANAISVYITQRERNPRASTQPGMSYMYHIYKWEADVESYIPIITSELGEIEESQINSWVTLPLEKDGEAEFLEPGNYVAAIETYHGGGAGADNNEFRFTIGMDKSNYYAAGKSGYMSAGDESWYQLEGLAMIHLHLNETGGPSVAGVTFNVDMNGQIAKGAFNPGSDYVDISGSFNDWGASDQMTDADGDGIYSLTVNDLPTLEEIQYSYRINGSWSTAEYPEGGPGRAYRVTYYNNTDDLYNNEEYVVGVETIDALNNINVYPNPSNGVFTLQVDNSQAINLNVVVTNLQGQVVFKKQLKQILNHQETIDLSSFSKGLYFLKVNNSVKKLIVQ